VQLLILQEYLVHTTGAGKYKKPTCENTLP